MRASTVTLVLLAILSSTACAQAPVDQIPNDQLTINGLYSYAKANQIESVEDLLPHLPPLLTNNYVLMEASHSRQVPSSTEHPRIIMFVPDGSLFVAVSSFEGAVGYDDVELLESTGNDTWRLAALKLQPNSHATLHTRGRNDTGSCTDCHGSKSRPIWGAYPAWTGAFGDGAAHELTDEQARVLTLAASPDPNAPNLRLHRLTFFKRQWQARDRFDLPDRYRKLSNESFNDAVGARHIENLWNRIRRSDDFELMMLAYLAYRLKFFEEDLAARQMRDSLFSVVDQRTAAAGIVLPNGTKADKVLRLVGLQFYDDLILSKSIPELTNELPEDQRNDVRAGWNYIAIYIGDLLAVRFLKHLVDEYPEYQFGWIMARTEADHAPTTIFAYFRESTAYMWETSLDDRLALLRVQAPPTVNLRFEQVFTNNLQAAIGPQLIEFGRKKLSAVNDVRNANP